MATDSARRSISVERSAPGRLTIVNNRGGRLVIGSGDDLDFSPTELLLAAIGGCTAIDVDTVTSRRAEPESFHVSVDADKVRDDEGNRLTDIVVTFRVAFPAGPDGDQARSLLPDIVKKSHDRLCTVSRTIERGTAIATTIA